jgi:hypothetical protein
MFIHGCNKPHSAVENTVGDQPVRMKSEAGERQMESLKLSGAVFIDDSTSTIPASNATVYVEASVLNQEGSREQPFVVKLSADGISPATIRLSVGQKLVIDVDSKESISLCITNSDDPPYAMMPLTTKPTSRVVQFYYPAIVTLLLTIQYMFSQTHFI